MHAAAATDHAGGSSAIVSCFALSAARTPAGIPLKRLVQASALQRSCRLLVTGVLAEDALAALVATGVASVTLVRPFHPYPDPQRADVIWVLGLDREETLSVRLGTALRCLAPGGRLLLELCGMGADQQAMSLAVRLRYHSLATVRVEALRPGVVLVRGNAPAHQQRAA